MTDADSLHNFLMECHSTTNESRMMINADPNVEVAGVERVLGVLEAQMDILVRLDTDLLPADEKQTLVEMLQYHISKLEELLSKSSSGPRIARRTERREGAVGRPALDVNLGIAVELHELGLFWKDIAPIIGTSRATLYRKLEQAGIPTKRDEADISDEELDAHMESLCKQFPFSGGTIMQGHLEAKNIRVSRRRVQASLRRVDAEGVRLRFVNWCGPQHPC